MGKIQRLQIRFHPAVSVRRPGVLAVRLRGGHRQRRTCRPHLSHGTRQTAAAPSRQRGKHVPRGGGFGELGLTATAPAPARRHRRRPVRIARSDRAEVLVELLLGQSHYGPTKPRPNVIGWPIGARLMEEIGNTIYKVKYMIEVKC